MEKPITVAIHSNIEQLQGLIAQAYVQSDALQATLAKINAFEIIATSDPCADNIDSVELARKAGERLGTRK